MNAVFFYCFDTNVDASAFWPVKVSFVSLQSEEFHIYTQYCTNYPRYALLLRCRSMFVRFRVVSGQPSICWCEALCAFHCAEYCGKTRKHAENGLPGCPAVGPFRLGVPIRASVGGTHERS